MAFQSMVNGADCGPSNPLKNLLKHVERDSQSARHDSFFQAGPSRFRTVGPTAGQYLQESEESRKLLDPSQRGASEAQSLFRELVKQAGAVVPSSRQDWSRQFGSNGIGSSAGPLSLEELAQMEELFQQQRRPLIPVTRTEEAHWAPEFTQSQVENLMSQSNGLSLPTPYNRPAAFVLGPDRFLSSRLGIFGHGYGSESHMGSMYNHLPVSIDQRQKGKFVELSDENWEAEFAKVGLEPSTQPGNATEFRTTSTETDTATEEALENTELTTQVDDSEEDAAFLLSLENTWKNLASNLNSASLLESDLAGWEREFANLNDPDRFINTGFTAENADDFLKDLRPYPYQAENVFVDHPDPLEEGRRLIASGAPLSQAALAFEAACQLDESRGEAWRMLGETHAADEKEHLAIKAFERAIGCGGADAQASWMSLAIAWVNEGHELRALATLERWLGDTYPDVVGSVLVAQREPTQNPWDRQSRVVDMFLAAARAGPNAREGPGKDVVRSQVVDADVQVGLGVLFYINSDYGRARDCFEAALGVNPSDFLLWNRLGATLANGGQPEEAIDAYRRALELRPTFTRAIYNLGVSCLNINCYKEAAEHLLAALSLHRQSGGLVSGISDKHPLLPDGDGSDNLWHTLRRAFMCLDRQDLADRAVPGADVDSFRSDGFEF